MQAIHLHPPPHPPPHKRSPKYLLPSQFKSVRVHVLLYFLWLLTTDMHCADSSSMAPDACMVKCTLKSVCLNKTCFSLMVTRYLISVHHWPTYDDPPCSLAPIILLYKTWLLSNYPHTHLHCQVYTGNKTLGHAVPLSYLKALLRANRCDHTVQRRIKEGCK